MRGTLIHGMSSCSTIKEGERVFTILTPKIFTTLSFQLYNFFQVCTSEVNSLAQPRRLRLQKNGSMYIFAWILNFGDIAQQETYVLHYMLLAHESSLTMQSMRVTFETEALFSDKNLHYCLHFKMLSTTVRMSYPEFSYLTFAPCIVIKSGTGINFNSEKSYLRRTPNAHVFNTAILTY